MVALAHVEQLFTELLELPTEQRAAQLAELTVSNPTLQIQLKTLLAAAEKAKGFLSRPPLAPIWKDAITNGAPPSILGQQLGPYRLMQELGQGGMGEVYLAKRADGHYHQQVAVKLIRPDVNADLLECRFRKERQILAQFSHPYIARLLDGGSHVDGRPYLVMEYVPGEPIDAFCRTQELPLNERLHLFIKVCEAVEYANQQGVIHRDLKPSNILVTAESQPKLLDFGIAKIVQPVVTEERSLTLGYSPLTPDFAAPEQLCNEPITAATDIYALGLLLYELITERKAFTSVLERAMPNSEPPLPSHVAPVTQRPQLRGALDKIVLQALAYRPEQRFNSARQLAERINHYLAQQNLAPQKGTPKGRAMYDRLGLFFKHPLLLKIAAIIVLLGLATLFFLSVIYHSPVGYSAVEQQQASTHVAHEPCTELSTNYANNPTDSAFIGLAQCQLEKARALNNEQNYSAALAILNGLHNLYQNHPGKHRAAPYAQASYILEEFARAEQGNGNLKQAQQYRQQQLKRMQRLDRRRRAKF